MAKRADRATADRGRPSAERRWTSSGAGTGETAVILDYMAHSRRKASRNPGSDRLLAEIVEALLFLGGQAHRDHVVARVVAVRGRDGDGAEGTLKAHLLAAFDHQYALDRSLSERPSLFDLPFGEGSHRWALAREAETFLRRGRKARDPASWRD